MNEIGEYSVDTDIIGKENVLRELLKGCICCTLKEELEIQLHSLYQQERPDVIYIETTGVAHPIEVLGACLANFSSFSGSEINCSRFRCSKVVKSKYIKCKCTTAIA